MFYVSSMRMVRLARSLVDQAFARVTRRLIFTTCAKNEESKSVPSGDSGSSMAYESIQYKVEGRVAHIVLNRPHRFNAIDAYMPFELERAVDAANLDDVVKIILLYGNKVFCSGYDLKQYAEVDRGSESYSQKMPWDPYHDFNMMSRCNRAWMSLWNSHKPVVCKIRGVAIGGGSDMALCCDIVVASEDARIGYPPSRVWGCPTTAMWVYRVGAERAKRILFTGQILTGKEAAAIGLISQAVPDADLDRTADELVARMVNVPTNQLFFQKQVINQAVEQLGLSATQRLATVFDGMSRHTPEGIAFQRRAKEVGFKKAVLERDSGDETVWSNLDIDPSHRKSKL